MVSYNSSHSHGNNPQEPNNQKPQHHLLSVNKPPSKKPPQSAAPGSGSTQPRVYNVKPIHFRELVQRLTGAASQAQAQAHPQPQPPPQRLQSAAPPPIQLGSHLNAWATTPVQAYANINGQKTETSSVGVPQDPTAGKYQKKSTAAGVGFSDGFLIGDGMELSLSPTTCSWFSFPLLSPGPLSNFGA